MRHYENTFCIYDFDLDLDLDLALDKLFRITDVYV